MLPVLKKLMVILFFNICSNANAVNGFSVQNLPLGSDVTLPGPAVTLVPLTERIKLSSTDRPQTIKLSSVNTKGGRGVPFKITIFDSKKVKFITLEPGNSYLYSFSKVGSISVVSEKPRIEGDVSHYQLQIESDKPLNIAR